MKIKKGYVMRKVGGKNAVVPTGKACGDFNGMIILNDTAAFLWTFFKDKHTCEEAVKALLERYDVDEASATTDVKEFIELMETNGIGEKTEK